mgnify:FL=1
MLFLLFSRHLLFDHNGNVNKRNRLNQTALHCLLQAGNEVRRNECLTLLLKWKEKNTNETIDLDAKDSVGLIRRMFFSKKTRPFFLS